MEDFENLFLIPELDSNDDNSFNSNSGASSPESQDFLAEISMPIEGNTNFLMSSNFFQDYKIKNETLFDGPPNDGFLTTSTFGEFDGVLPVQPQQSQSPSNSNNQQKNSIESSPQKKKRGRPKKVDTQAETKNEPKKRGRPKAKKENNSISEEDSVIDDSFENNKKLKKEDEELFSFSPSPSTTLQFKEPPSPGSAFNFKREELLSMTSHDLESYCEELKKHRSLTEEEENRFKKHNRLIRNRESAQKSRMKKRLYVDKLEKKIQGLEKQIHNLQGLNTDYLNQINSLKDRNQHLENLLKKVDPNSQETPKFDIKKGMFVFLIVFSFGLFFNFNLFSQQPKYIPITSSASHVAPFSHNRALLSKEKSSSTQSSSSTLSLPSSNKIPANPNSKMELVSSQNVLSQNNRYFKRKSENEGHEDKLVISSHDALIKDRNLTDDDLTDDTSYIYCSEAKRVYKGSPKSPVVGFLIPSDFLNDTNLVPIQHNQRPPLVEITCSVMDVHPIYPLAEKS